MTSNLIDWGMEFPIPGNIPTILNLCKEIKQIKKFIRTLLSIFFLYEDNSFLILPIKIFQSSKSCNEIIEFLNNLNLEIPNGIYYQKEENKILEIGSYCENNPIFYLFYENLTYSTFLITNNNIEKKNNYEQIGINLLNLISIQFQYPYLTILNQNNNDILVNSCNFSKKEKIWSIQTKLPEKCKVIIHYPSIYFLSYSKLYGCSFDDLGQRQFPRPLTTILENSNLIYIKSLNNFYLFDSNISTILRIEGLTITKTEIDKNCNNCKKIVSMGSKIFCLFNNKILSYDLTSRTLDNPLEVPNTEKWLISLESSYGLVFLGNISKTISKCELPPFINLFAPNEELYNQMKKIKETTKTVAGPLLLLSNRSPDLAITLMYDDIIKEISNNYSSETIQSAVQENLKSLIKEYSLKPIRD